MPATKLAFTSRPALASTTPSFIDGREADELEQAVSQRIRDRARVLFEESGAAAGNDEANWLRAESEILHANLQVRESGTWLALSASIPDASGQGMQIVVRPTRVLVRATHGQNEQESGGRTEQHAQELFLAANLTAEVDPPSAAASFRDHNLNLMVKKRRPDQLTGSSENASI
jgi:HSP20 family molecular chaperone IbpA